MPQKKDKKPKLRFEKTYMHIPIYELGFMVITGNDADKIGEVLKEYDEDGLTSYATSWRSRYKGQKCFFVHLNFEHPKLPINHGVIAHEALHMTHYLMDSVGLEFDHKNPEIGTYILEWYVNQIYRHLKKYGYHVDG